ncbi:MAG: S-methyl-5'-thioinosine phosphorylase [Pseudomonadales bacterium]|nr:S-methyl-5'-thioinosine phosphorylase [Pseudomonadales bacterium]
MLGLIGGSGLTQFPELKVMHEKTLTTPYGDPSAAIVIAELAGQELAFLARHGSPHVIAPHQVNYRANIWALKELGVKEIVAINAVGGICVAQDTAVISVPDQIIDYTYGREMTFCDHPEIDLLHIDFSQPYDENLRQHLIEAAETVQLPILKQAVHGVTQGPRLETAAEIQRMARDGCDIVGMTGMPEAALARELDLPFACIAIVVNKAAGLSDHPITLEDIHKVLDDGIIDIKKLLKAFCLLKSGL